MLKTFNTIFTLSINIIAFLINFNNEPININAFLIDANNKNNNNNYKNNLKK